MAFSLLALLHPALVVQAQRHPLWADLSGGLKEVTDLQGLVEKIRENIFKISGIKSAVAADARLDLPPPPKVSQ
jgi:fatty acid synthase subunit alpha, fungi type